MNGPSPWPETALTFDCKGHTLIGILHHAQVPSRGAEDALAHGAPEPCPTGMVVVVGGPQYRTGSHRLFVDLCRSWADAGIASLRFDVRGMGDSLGESLGFEALSDDIDSAITALLHRVPTLRRVALWGLCDGASAALLYLHERPDPRVAGLCLLNPWVRTPQLQAKTQIKHYYRDRVRQADFWRKVVSGRVAMKAAQDLWLNLRLAQVKPPNQAAARFPNRMAQAWRQCPGPIQIVLSGHDHTAKEFIEHSQSAPEWQGLLQRPGVQRLDLPQADHTVSDPDSKRLLMQASTRFIRQELAACA